MADDHDRLAPARDERTHVVRRRARSETLVGFGLEADRGRDAFAGLARAEQRAREDGIGLDSFAHEAPAELARLLLSVGRERAQLIRLARRSLRVAHEKEAHGPRVLSLRESCCTVYRTAVQSRKGSPVKGVSLRNLVIADVVIGAALFVLAWATQNDANGVGGMAGSIGWFGFLVCVLVLVLLGVVWLVRLVRRPAAA
jgi:hypothetical protein